MASADLDEVSIVAEDDQYPTDTDSAYGEGSSGSGYSTSLASSVYNHVYENGRRYHSYREGTYLNPDDEDEQDRLDLQHHIWRMVLGGQLYTAPLREPLQILDLGTGTGIWAMEIADEFPAALVTGTDVSPIQPSWVPPNCHFYIDDVEGDWTFSQPFDYIHGRAMGNVISDWKKFYSEAMKHLKPGGWLEIQDFEATIKSDDGTVTEGSFLKQWVDDMATVSEKFGKNYNAIVLQEDLMRDAGFVNIKHEMFKVPVAAWPRDKKLKEIGKFMELMMCKAADSYTPAPYTRVLGYTLDQVNVFIELLKKELCDRKIHKYCTWHFIAGQKATT